MCNSFRPLRLSAGGVPILLICLVAAVVYTYKLGAISFENYDHFQFVKTADEMMQSADALALTHNYRPYLNKPHLLFWNIWFFSLPFGSLTTISARLPGVLSAIGCIALVFLLSDELFGRRAACISSVVLLATWEFAINARRVRFDVMLALFTILALYALLKGTRSERRKLIWYMAGGIAIALAFLTKGPPAFIHILLPFVLFLLVTRKSGTEWGVGFL